jgi:hypothetical protein
MTPQDETDRQHIRLLALFHFVLGGLCLLGIGMILVHYVTIWALVPQKAAAPDPAEMARTMSLVVVFYVVGGVMSLGMFVGNVLAGIFLQKRINRVFIMVVSVLNCLNIPLGTTLGVFTLIVLMRPSVTNLFAIARSV